MNIDDLTYGQLKSIAALFNLPVEQNNDPGGLIGKYVIVRCRDAGVHSGFLASYSGRECTLKHSRRLWYWKPADNKSFLSGVAVAGLHSSSKVGTPVPIIHLTENCEIIQCTDEAIKSIQDQPDHDQ